MAINTFEIKQLLENSAGVKAVTVAATGSGTKGQKRYSPEVWPSDRQEEINGTPLYKKNARGIWYFMPVSLREATGFQDREQDSQQQRTIELQNALISVTARKTIVETPLVGRKGTVKELVNIEESVIKISAFIHSDDGSYPAEEIELLKQLWDSTRPLEIISVLTDLLLEPDEHVVITELDVPRLEGVDNGIKIDMTLKTDRELELIEL